MISLDTNVILSALNGADVNHQRAISLLDKYSEQAFCICPIVRAELRASGSWEAIQAWLTLQGVSVLWEMPENTWDLAGAAFGHYAGLRKGAALPRGIVADFLIAAHAKTLTLDVLTFDETVFKAVFPDVHLLEH